MSASAATPILRQPAPVRLSVVSRAIAGRQSSRRGRAAPPGGWRATGQRSASQGQRSTSDSPPTPTILAVARALCVRVVG